MSSPVDVRTEIARRQEYGPGGIGVWFRAPEIAARAEPGQFVMIGIANGLRPYLRRAFSVADVQGDEIELLSKTVGFATAALADAPMGTPVEILGPLGEGYDLGTGAVTLVAGGIGVGPFPLTARRLVEAGQSVTAYIGARTEAEFVAVDRLEALADQVHLTTDDGTFGFAGNVVQLLRRELIAGTRPDRVLACGPVPMLSALAPILMTYGIPTQFAMEADMACGFGVCLGCVVPRANGSWLTVCREGPCVDPREVDWEKYE